MKQTVATLTLWFFLPIVLSYTNITHNSGILPINLGPAKLQRTSHTILHYYSLDPLIEELQDLQKQYNTLQANLQDKPSLRHDLGNHNKIILHIQSLISSKLHNINNTSPGTRTRRALYDNIGSLVKFATGNLDSSDGDRYDKILEDLDNKDKMLQKQIELQYSLSQEAIKRFDSSIKNIEHNEANLKFKIQQLVNISDSAVTIRQLFIAKDIYSQLIFLYSSILSILQDLENALTFCKLRTYHPSILSLQDLNSQIDKVKQTRNLNIAPDDLDISELQKSIEVDCKIEQDRISFFLSFPINYDTVFELFYLLPIPTYNGHEYCTVIPNSKYYLKSRNLIKALNGPCILGKPHQCLQKNVNVNGDICEREIVLNGSTRSCEYVKLEIKENHFEFIPEINQYLAVFPNKEVLRIESTDSNEIKELQGIFLVEPSKGQLFFRDNVVYFQSKSVGKPTLMSSPDITTVNSIKYSGVKLQLHSLNLEDLNPNQVSNIEDSERYENIYWNYLNIITLILICVLLVLQGIKRIPVGLFKPAIPFASSESQGSNPELSSPVSNQLYPDISPLGNTRI
uniref:Envelope protein n=2 Tax=Cacopsylla melanoneura TaxID=428564 RepID=A0A8D8LHT5_9HEMI